MDVHGCVGRVGRSLPAVSNFCLCIQRPPTLPRLVRVAFYMVPMSIFQCVCVYFLSFNPGDHPGTGQLY